MKQETKNVALCCPHHGLLREPVQYISANMGSKTLVDLAVVYCHPCKKYYTPFNNLLALVKIKYHGHSVVGSQGRVQRSVPRVKVRVPYFTDTAEENRHQEQIREEDEKRKKQLLIEKAEKRKQYLEELPEVYHDCVVLTNKPCFINNHECPHCHETTKKEHVKITQYGKFLYSHLWRCSRCGFDYITPSQVEAIRKKANQKIRGYYHGPFVLPVEIECELQEDGRYLFIPKWALNFEKYDHHHLPPKGDDFYDMTDEEYLWVKMYHQPEEFSATLRTKSFLGEAGYSTSESETRRHIILEGCVNEYGKSKVINQLKSNINLRLKQKDGNIRYQHALNIWNGDLWYVEHKL